MFVVTVCAQDRQKLIEELKENNYLPKDWDNHPEKYGVFGGHYFQIFDETDINKLLKAGKENISHIIIETDRNKYNDDVCSDVHLPKFYKSARDAEFDRIINES